MVSSKTGIFKGISFSVLCWVLFTVEGIHAQRGQKSKLYCAMYRSAGVDPSHYPAIAGGVVAGENEYPHMVALGYGDRNNRTWGCGGSLVSENCVLTAAHCTFYNNNEVKIVRVGTTNIQNPSPYYADHEITQIVKHPKYKFPQNYHDIAILRLKSAVTIGNRRRPACLEVNATFDTTTLSATGWGSQGNGQPPSSNLLKVDLVYYNNAMCRGFYKNLDLKLPYGVEPESFICAGGSGEQRKDTCQGDSGGPLQILHDQQYYIVGVSSFGRTCATPGVPGIYIRISNYIPWLEDTIWP